MKYLKKFNEERAPYNYDFASERLKISWSEDEIDDLEKMGADSIKDSTAIISDDDLVLVINKTRNGYKVTPNKELLTYHYDRRPGGPHGSLKIDKSKKVQKKYHVKDQINTWEELLIEVDAMFRMNQNPGNWGAGEWEKMK